MSRSTPSLASTIGLISLIASLVSSSAKGFPTTDSQSSLLQIAERIDQTGKPSVIRGVVAEALGFPDADIRVRERGFRKIGEQFTHVCSTSDLLGFENLLFLASVDEATGDALVWRATRQGELVSTARFANGVAKPIGNQQKRSAFVGEKEYFIKQMRSQSSHTNSAPVPRQDVTPGSGKTSARRADEKTRRRDAISEIVVVFSNPWVLPVIALVLALGGHRASRRH